MKLTNTEATIIIIIIFGSGYLILPINPAGRLRLSPQYRHNKASSS
jgi:hypothetical protein